MNKESMQYSSGSSISTVSISMVSISTVSISTDFQFVRFLETEKSYYISDQYGIFLSLICYFVYLTFWRSNLLRFDNNNFLLNTRADRQLHEQMQTRLLVILNTQFLKKEVNCNRDINYAPFLLYWIMFQKKEILIVCMLYI